MNLENKSKESALERAKRLRAEKEAKDQARVEDETNNQAEDQARAEKLKEFNSSKQDLENQLEDVNFKIEASRSEAHETRDEMKDGGLDKDEDFKEDYRSTISEVAGNLNELRNEKNRIKAELEKINLEIENFEVNEAISEGKEAVQGELENINQENEEVITRIESYSGAGTEDFEEAKEIVKETNEEVVNLVREVEDGPGEIIDAQLKEEKLKKFESLVEDKQAENNSLRAEYESLNEKLDDKLRRKAGRGSDNKYEEFSKSFAPDFNTVVSNLEKKLVELVKKVRDGEKSQSILSGEQQIARLQNLVDRMKYNVSAYSGASPDTVAKVFSRESKGVLPNLSMVKIYGVDKYRDLVVEENEYLRKLESSPEVIKIKEEESSLLNQLNESSKELSDLKYKAYNLRNEIIREENKTKQEKTT